MVPRENGIFEYCDCGLCLATVCPGGGASVRVFLDALDLKLLSFLRGFFERGGSPEKLSRGIVAGVLGSFFPFTVFRFVAAFLAALFFRRGGPLIEVSRKRQEATPSPPEFQIKPPILPSIHHSKKCHGAPRPCTHSYRAFQKSSFFVEK